MRPIVIDKESWRKLAMTFSSTVKRLSEASRGPWEGGVEIFKRTEQVRGDRHPPLRHSARTQRVRTFHMNFFDGLRKVGKGIYMVEDRYISDPAELVREEQYEGFRPFEPYTGVNDPIMTSVRVTHQTPLSCITFFDHFCMFRFRSVDRVERTLIRDQGRAFVPRPMIDRDFPEGTGVYPCKNRDHMMALTRAVLVTGLN